MTHWPVSCWSDEAAAAQSCKLALNTRAKDLAAEAAGASWVGQLPRQQNHQLFA